MNTLEKIKKVYHDTYLALLPNDTVELGRFINFSYHHEVVFRDGNFQVFHALNEKETLVYDCSFMEFKKAKAIYESMAMWTTPSSANWLDS